SGNEICNPPLLPPFSLPPFLLLLFLFPSFLLHLSNNALNRSDATIPPGRRAATGSLQKAGGGDARYRRLLLPSHHRQHEAGRPTPQPLQGIVKSGQG